MDDLISRKDVITIIENMMFEVGKDLSKSYLLQDARERIIRLNTAFDKEKVIEELKANMNSFAGISGQAVTFMFSNGYYNGTKDAIEIVKKGGIE